MKRFLECKLTAFAAQSQRATAHNGSNSSSKQLNKRKAQRCERWRWWGKCRVGTDVVETENRTRIVSQRGLGIQWEGVRGRCANKRSGDGWKEGAARATRVANNNDANKSCASRATPMVPASRTTTARRNNNDATRVRCRQLAGADVYSECSPW